MASGNPRRNCDESINEQDDESSADGDGDGGVAVKEADPQNSEPGEHPLGDAYNLSGFLCFDAFVVSSRHHMAATILMGHAPEELDLTEKPE